MLVAANPNSVYKPAPSIPPMPSAVAAGKLIEVVGTGVVGEVVGPDFFIESTLALCWQAYRRPPPCLMESSPKVTVESVHCD